jgi:hypothetical protein
VTIFPAVTTSWTNASRSPGVRPGNRGRACRARTSQGPSLPSPP